MSNRGRPSGIFARVIAVLSPGGVADSRAVFGASLRVARSDLDDAQAQVALEREIRGHEAGVDRAAAMLGANRSEFVTDRAFRLLEAVLRHAPVEMIGDERRELFSREENLGRAEIGVAFQSLADIEPQLDQWRRSGHTDGTVPPVDRVSVIVGPRSRHPDALIRSQLALSVVSHYIACIQGRFPPDALTEPYFAAARRIVARSG